MPSSASLAASLLLLAAAHAIPNPVHPLEPRATDAALEPWVTVNDDGKPSTVTPVLTTVSGTPTVVDGAPHDVTATVFTYTSYGKIVTSTGEPPGPTATSTGDDGAGSFAQCSNLDGEFAPWCHPDGESPLYVGTAYYFIWDPTYFKAPNATVQVVGNYINKTTGEVKTESPAFLSTLTPATFGYASIKITAAQLLYQGSQNISLSLVGAVNGTRQERPGPQILITTRPGPVANAGNHVPHAQALYIALPTVFGFIILCVAGTCLWNRHRRRIHLRNVMGRNYEVNGKAGRKRFGRLRSGGRDKAAKKANERIQLMEREVAAEGGEVYRDLPDPADRPRRDSDALGSLAGTPTDDRRMNLGRDDHRDRSPATGNSFRDELRRQENERS
ncbi:hypothetical protein F4802DRAFT_591083 [Xylaria palmicola]|nr:hypothetical protein F4802DRAFT_591083 [Xylaria palmicola]